MSRWLGLGLLVLAACGGAGAKRVHKPGQEYLTGLAIEGNTSIASEDLIPGLSLEHNAEREMTVDDYQMQLDKERIATAYQKKGFLSVEVHSRLDHHGDAVRVVFAVTEGARAVTHVEIDGLPPEVPLARARALVAIQEGGPFDYDAYEDAKDPLQLLVEDAGYAHVHVEANVIADQVHARATIRYAVDSGPPCTFGAITVIGPAGMLGDAARARITFQAGERYSTSQLVRTQNALYAFGRFSSVRVDPDRVSDATTVAVKITLAEGDHNELRLGFGGGVDPLTYFGRIHVAYSRVGVITPLTTFVADLRPEYALEQDECGWDFWHCKRDPRVRLLGTLTQQDLFIPNVKGDLELGVDYLTVEAYTKAGAHSRLGLTTPLGTPKLMLRVSWTYAYSDFTKLFIDPSYAPMLGVDHDNYVGAYNAAVLFDMRDKPVEPTVGFYVDARVTKGTKFALGDYDYVQATPELRAFFTLLGTTFAVRGRVGGIWGDVPETERYYGGGMSSMRGFSQRRLSPSVPGAIDPKTMLAGAPVVVGGAGLVETSLEVRHSLGSPGGVDLGGLVFVDGGDVTGTVSELDVLNQHWAVGVGLRYLSPIGPIGLDVAYRLNRNGVGEPEYGESRFTFLLAVGEAF
jgi:outer membrane protein insertion porin family/translocation and assembly module TamA